MSSRSKIYKLKETPEKSVENNSGMNRIQFVHDVKEKETTTAIPVEADDNLADTNCGMGSCQPQGLQCFVNMKFFVFFYSLLSACTQTNSPYLSSQITSIEKQFQLSSTLSGSLLSCNEVGQLVFVLLVSYFGHKGHIPRIIGAFSLIYSVGMLITAMPNYFSGYTLPKVVPHSNLSTSVDTTICSASKGSGNVTDAADSNMESQASAMWALYVIGASVVIQGIGKSPKRSLSATYIDNNVPDRTNTGVYLGITVAASIFGPSLAILVGSGISTIPVDFSDTLLKTTDPRWVGCWWLGFVIFGLFGIVTSIPMLFFPKRLKNAAAPATTERPIVKQSDEKSLCVLLKDFPICMLRIFRKPVFTLTLMAISVMSFSVTGIIYFGPKYLQNQFFLPAWQSNIIHGVSHLIVSVMGTFIGGLLTSKLKMDNYKCSKFILLISFTGFALNTGLVFIGCDDQSVVGLDADILKLNDGLEPMEPTCFCDRTTFLPVCGQDQKNYLNPCVAQCWNKTDTTYGGCMEVEGGSATLGFCDTGCSSLIVYMVMALLQSMMGTLTIMPNYLLIIRSVDESDKAVAVGLFVFFTSILGWLPAPIIYGTVIDGACRLWNMKDGRRGSCELYFLEKLRTHFLGMEASLRFICLVLFCVIYLLCRRQASKEDFEKKGTKCSKMDKSDAKTVECVKKLEIGD